MIEFKMILFCVGFPLPFLTLLSEFLVVEKCLFEYDM